jgi:hypothetical protein
MHLAKRLPSFTAALSIAGLIAGTAVASPVAEPVPGYAGHATVTLGTGVVIWDQALPAALSGLDVYSNVGSSPNFGFSSTALASVFGDRLTTTGIGTLEENTFTIYNAPNSAGPLLSASFQISFFDGPTGLPIGGYSTPPVTLGAGVPAGSYAFITVNGASALNLNLPTDVIVTQKVLAFTGTATRLGIVSLDPPSVGGSTPQMYIDSPPTGPPGFYTITGQIANPGYRINVIPPPVPNNPTSWGRIKNLYR